MNATWKSNSTGPWITFATNTSINNDTNITQTNNNFTASNTKYYWSVNLTDGNNEWDNKTYHFTTNQKPTLTNEAPTNQSTNITSKPTLYAVCTDPDSDTMNAEWLSNSSGSWVQFGTTTGISSTDNISKQNTNFSTAGTKYWWSVNLTDGCNWTNATYGLTINDAPTLTNEAPTDTLTNICPIPTLHVVCTDANNDVMNATWNSNSSGSWVQFGTTTYINTGTNISKINNNFTASNTNYWWSVNLTDGKNWTNETYSFTTNQKPTLTNEAPTNGSTDVITTPALYVVCTDPDGDTMTATWRYNDSNEWWTFATNTSISTGTNITQSNSNFSNTSQTYYWTVNLTDGCNWTNATYHFTTEAAAVNNAPWLQDNTNTPANTTTNICPIPTLYINCIDNDTGDTMNATWKSNSTGPWITFATNTSINNDTNITQTNNNFTASNTKYYWSVNLTDGNNEWDNKTYHFTTNQKPTLTNEAPTNQSTNITSKPTLYAVCTDPDSDTMNAEWLSNSSGSWVQFGTTTGISSTDNISKQNTNFSTAGTKYWWSVNLTDGCNWTNATYGLTINDAPTLTDEAPTNESTNVSTTPALYVVCSDVDSDVLTASWWYNDSGSWWLFGTNSSFNTGTNITQVNGNFSNSSSTYYWSVNVTDGKNWSNATYYFTTNYVPYLAGVSPADGSTGISTSPQLYVVCNDNDSDVLTASWWYNDSNNWWQFATNSSVNSGTNITQTNSNFSNNSATYYWSVNVTDGKNWSNATYDFTTNSASTFSNEAPTNGSSNVSTTPGLYVVCSDVDSDVMTATWWYNDSNNWWQFGTNSSFNTGTNITQTNSNFSNSSATYYWSVNLTDGKDWSNSTYSFTVNNPATLSSPSPANGSTENDLYPSCNITVTDSDGGPLTVYYYENTTGSWVRQQTNSSVSSGTTVSWSNYTNASNYNTTYYWSVNVTDGVNWTNSTYQFTTKNDTLIVNISLSNMLAGYPYRNFSYNVTIAGTGSIPALGDVSQFYIKIYDSDNNDVTNTLFSASGYDFTYFTNDYNRTAASLSDIYATSVGTYTFYAYNNSANSTGNNATLNITRATVSSNRSMFYNGTDQNNSAYFNVSYGGGSVNGTLRIDNLSDVGSYNKTWMNTSFDGSSDAGLNTSVEVSVNGSVIIYDITAEYLPSGSSSENISFWFKPKNAYDAAGAYALATGQITVTPYMPGSPVLFAELL